MAALYSLWIIAIEFMMHPLALMVLLYRDLRSIDFGYKLSFRVNISATGGDDSDGDGVRGTGVVVGGAPSKQKSA